MSAQPQHAPIPPSAPAPAPAAAAELLERIRADRRAERWVPAFERDWAGALEDSRHSYSLTPLHDVVRAWQARLKAAPAVDAFLASGMDDSDGIPFEEDTEPRR
ncbi:DUF6247 family protein [Streptomyces niger]|uniref:DUF6247 family protein n=1 Tax=Streptomyces niger TaxID=66373 RepID=UPI00069B5A53|nr:DUF6247 family protein [Streptomyces niger]